MADFLLNIKETSEVLGEENINCLINLFKEMDGKPPCVDKKRYRANYPEQIDILNYLEQSAHLIKTKTIQTQQFYHLRPYAIPLIKGQKAQNLLNLMCEMYEKLSVFYKKRLDKNVTRDELLKAVDAPHEKILEALFYFEEAHSVWIGWGKGFPYEEGSHINISEDIILKESFLEVLTDYYRWHFINQKESNLKTDSQKEIALPKIKIEDKKKGRPSLKKIIIAAYDILKEESSFDYSKNFKSHTQLIQDKVLQLNPNIKDLMGLDYKTLSKYLSEKFQEDKKSLK
jgi:hypothetical protein